MILTGDRIDPNVLFAIRRVYYGTIVNNDGSEADCIEQDLQTHYIVQLCDLHSISIGILKGR